ncbi:MAG: bifunctional ADP-heptose synthase [Bacteroidales bacterium]|nr:bifunctional ADP-heptose synthase [Bacteroidales bacterium]
MNIDKIFSKFEESTILVVGDVMIDAYLTGKVSRISPEAPVPIVEVKDRIYRLGGAANVALNLKSLGAKPILCSVIGKDGHEQTFLNLLNKNDLITDGICASDKRPTTIKYRIIGNKAQMLRIDDECDKELEENEKAFLLKRIESIFATKKIDAVIFEDYDKGVLSKDLIEKIIALAKQHGAIITVDPKKRNFNYYVGVNLFKPNLKELQDGLNQAGENLPLDTIQSLMSDFAKKMKVNTVMTTLSERGIAIYDQKDNHFFSQPAFLRRISDVSGAGDTVISVVTLCLVAQADSETTAVISNLAGGIVCESAGVVPIEAAILKQHAKTELTNS